MSKMIAIPTGLLEQLERRNVLLFIGEGINRDILPSSAELAKELAARCDYPPEEPLSWPRVAGYYELTRKDRHGLITFLQERIGKPINPSPAHRLVAQLGTRVMVTTCLDELLKRALHEAQVAYTPVVGNAEVAYSDEQRLLLVSLWGVLEQPDSLIITNSDRRRFLDARANLSDVLRGELAQRTWLFIGLGSEEQWFRSFYDQVTRTLDRHSRRAYLVGSEIGRYARAEWQQQHNAELLDVAIEPFLRQLIKALAARARPTPVAPPLPDDDESPLALPERPYKFLDYYDTKDAAIFYGRQRERQQLCALIHAHRLVLLYGASGVGKTSLLLAGAVPRLKRATQPYEAIYIRALEDPALVIRRRVRRLLPDAKLPNEGTLLDFLAAATEALGQTLVIILDQFEEFFIRLSPQFRAAFITQLGTLVDARDVPIKIVFSLREDWLASMDEIEARLRQLGSSRMRLLRLTRQQAYEAITAPVERLGVSYEPTLLERLLDDLLGSNQAVMPPQLQLVCSALYDGRRDDDRIITVALYERLGGAKGVLQQYLAEELARLAPASQALARGVLEELVTSQGTKAVKSSADLALRLDVKLQELVPVLERLVRVRLLRALKDESGQRAYELAHEYLIHEIHLTADTQARKQAEELIQQEVENWQRFTTVLAADKLALINEVRDVLRLNDDAQALLLQSALQVGYEIEYWLNRINDPSRRVTLLSEASRSKLSVVRQRAAETLGTQDVPEAVEPLVRMTLHDSNMARRDFARQSLAQLSKQQPIIVARLRAEVEKTTGETRLGLLRTLTYLPLSGLPIALRLQVLMIRLRLRMIWLVEVSLATPQRRAIAMMNGLIIVLVALGYLFSMNSYHVYHASSDIRGKPNTIIIAQGYPWLPSMGLDQKMVDTGISVTLIENTHWPAIKDEKVVGFWLERDVRGYRKWGQQVADALKLEERAPMLWYLGQKEEAFEILLEATSSQNVELRQTSALMLADVLMVNSKRRSPQAMQALPPLLSDEEPNVRYRGAIAVVQVVEAKSEQTQQVIEALLELLEDSAPYVRGNTTYVMGQVVEAKPELAQQAIKALLPLLSDEEPNVRGNTTYVMGQVVEAKPELAGQVIQPLLSLLSDEEPNVRGSAAFAMRQVVKAKPELTQQVIKALLSRLSNEEPNVRGSAAFAVAQVVEAKPELLQQVIQPLLSLLSDEEPNVRGSAAIAVAQLAQAKPELYQQVIEVLPPLLEDSESHVRANAARAVGQVLEAKPELYQQVIEVLPPLLEDSDSDVRANAARAVVPVLEAKPELAGQVIEALPPLLSDPNLGISAMSVVEQVVEAKPELAGQVIEALLPLLKDSKSYIRSNAAIAVGQVVETKPELAQEVIQALLPLLLDSDSWVRDNGSSAVARIYAYQKDESFLLDRLKDPRNPLQRSVAARALFLITLQDSTRDESIRHRLEEHATSPEPMERIWANKTLAMLDLASQAHEAVYLDDEQREEITNKLQYFTRIYDDEVNFFGEDFSWAAGEALDWLFQQQMDEENAE